MLISSFAETIPSLPLIWTWDSLLKIPLTLHGPFSSKNWNEDNYKFFGFFSLTSKSDSILNFFEVFWSSCEPSAKAKCLLISIPSSSSSITVVNLAALYRSKTSARGLDSKPITFSNWANKVFISLFRKKKWKVESDRYGQILWPIMYGAQISDLSGQVGWVTCCITFDPFPLSCKHVPNLETVQMAQFNKFFLLVYLHDVFIQDLVVMIVTWDHVEHWIEHQGLSDYQRWKIQKKFIARSVLKIA